MRDGEFLIAVSGFAAASRTFPALFFAARKREEANFFFSGGQRRRGKEKGEGEGGAASQHENRTTQKEARGRKERKTLIKTRTRQKIEPTLICGEI